MQKAPLALGLFVASCALGMSVVSPRAEAQTTGVALSCGTNYCQASASSPGSPTPFKYTWSYTGTAHLSSPFTCNANGPLGHKSSCTFHCYVPYEDHITMHVSVVDAAGTYIGDASAAAICDGSTGSI